MNKRLQPSKRPPKRTVIVHARIEEELAQRLQDLAYGEDRKISNYIARVLRKHVDEIDKESQK